MKKIILSAVLALFAVPVFASAADVTNFAELNAALADTSTTTITIQGVIQLTSQLNINRPITLIGAPGSGFMAAVDFGSDNSTKHLIEIDGIATGTVELTNLDFDSALKANGIQAYSMSDDVQVVLSNVTIQNSKSIGLTVNGSNVTATNLTTTGNLWGAVNVDPGSGVTGTSTFTLNTSNLTESTQIWSDGAHVTPNSSVVVNASGYDKYAVAGAPTFFLWTTRAVPGKAVNSTTKVIYPTIQSAIDAATAGDTITISAGTYTEQVLIDKNLTITGTDKATTVIKAPALMVNDVLGRKAVVEIRNGATVTASNLTVTGPGSTGCASIDYGFYVVGTSTLNLSNSNITDIKDTPFSGCQNGNGIRVGSSALLQSGTATINNVSITSYQKGGIVIDGIGSFATITNNTVTGVGATPSIAQNGIQISRGASATITGNTVSGNSYTGGTGICSGDGSTAPDLAAYLDNCDISTGILFFQQGSGISMTGNTVTASQIGTVLFGGSSVSVKDNNLSGNILRDLDTDVAMTATPNFWGSALDPTIDGSLSTTTLAVFSPWYTNAAMTSLSSATSTVGSSVAITLGSQTSITTGSMTIDIPAGTTIKGDLTWDGTITAPTATTTTVTVSGFTTEVGQAITIGSDSSDLTFNNAVRLLFAGQAGKHVGWTNHEGAFAEIADTCSADTQAAGDTLATGGNCKIDVGSDLVVWTKHFTTFATYTQTAVPAPTGGSFFVGSNGSGSSGSTVADTNTPVVVGQVLGVNTSTEPAKGQVLGVSAYAFGRDMRFGARGVDVEELQKMLIARGHLKLSVTTQYFGSLTKAAVIKWQKANGLPATGFFGPMSRAVNAK